MRLRNAIMDILQPREAHQQGAQEERPVQVRPDGDDQRDQPEAAWVGPAIDDEQEDALLALVEVRRSQARVVTGFPQENTGAGR